MDTQLKRNTQWYNRKFICKNVLKAGYRLNKEENRYNFKINRSIKSKERRLQNHEYMRLAKNNEIIADEFDELSSLNDNDFSSDDYCQQKLEVNGFTTVPTREGTSEDLCQLITHLENESNWQALFNCGVDTFKEMDKTTKKEIKGDFNFLNDEKTTYTDQSRKQFIVDDGGETREVRKIKNNKKFKKIRSELEAILKKVTGLEGYHLVKLVILKTELNRNGNIWRQQYHTDWSNFTGDRKFFILVPFDDNQTILTRDQHNCEVCNESKIPKDQIFIGKDSLVHAGSSTVGYRLHGVYVPKTSDEVDSNQEVTCLHSDPKYPH